MSMQNMKAIRDFCQQHYDEDTYKHVLRVADYTLENPVVQTMDDEKQELIYAVALLHDMVEDAPKMEEKCVRLLLPYMEIDIVGGASQLLKALTHMKSESYLNYIQRLRDTNGYIGHIAYIVKLADMKDHLMQKDTLTDKLKEKYWEALPYLL